MPLSSSGPMKASLVNTEIGRGSASLFKINNLEERYLAASGASGFLDTDFNVGTGANSHIETTSIGSDGKVVIGGFFTSYSGTTRNRIVRLHANGVLDTSFDVGTGANGTVWTTAIQSDGKVIICGDFSSYSGTTTNRVARLHSNGVLETSFNVGTGANNAVSAISIQSDGRVIIGGAFTSYSGTTTNRIARLHSNGVLDTGFNVGTGANSTVFTTSIDSDGKVIIGGDFSSYSGTTTNRVARLHSNGVLDTGFNVGTGAVGTVCTISIQSNGRVIIGGDFTIYSGTTTNYIARLHSNGVLDTGFNVGEGAEFTVLTTAIQSDGKVIIGGSFTEYSGTITNRIARLHSNGVLDTGFNVGTGPGTFPNFVKTTPIQPDGKVIIGGRFTSYSGTSRNRIARINTEIYRNPPKTTSNTLVKFSEFYSKSFIPVPGTLDSTFNVGVGTDSPFGSVCSSSIQSDGKVIIGGQFTTYSGTTRNRIARINADGSVDSGFNVGTGANNTVFSTVIQNDGKIVIGGSFTQYSGNNRSSIARILDNGSVDTGFNVGTGANLTVCSVSLQSDGKVIIGGNFTSYSGTGSNRVARLHANGVLDTGFNALQGPNSFVTTIFVQPDSSILIGGSFTSYSGTTRNRIARVNSNGSLDTGIFSNSGFNGVVNKISMDLNGRILVGGNFSSYSGDTINRVARLYFNGVLDTSFNVGTGASSNVCTLSISSDGKILLGGNFTSYSSETSSRIARLHSNGVRDELFKAGANSRVYTFSIQSDGKVVVGGEFETFNGESKMGVVRINAV